MDNPKTQFDYREQCAQWVVEFGDSLYNWAFHKVSDKQTAEDLVQETFLAALKSVENFQGKSSPKTWLFSILNHKIIDYYRKSSKTFISLDEQKEKRGIEITESAFCRVGKWNEPDSPFEEPESHLLDNDDFKKVLDSCIENLPKAWKTILLSKYLLGKDGNEICQEMEITPSNYWQIIHRSKLSLKKCLDSNWFNKN